jgi:streptogramin lyase
LLSGKQSAHAIRVDPEGNIWAVDAPGHVIYKMNPQGKVIMQLGRKGVPGMGPGNFNLPTDVAFASNGEATPSLAIVDSNR